MGPISYRKAEWLHAKHLLFSLLFVGIVRPFIESAPLKPNKFYHTVEVDTFRFRFPAEYSHSQKGGEAVPKRNAGVTKFLHHNIHPTMMNSTSSTQWMKNVVLQSLEGDKHRAKAIFAANSKLCDGATASVPVVSGNQYGTTFIVTVRLGTPPSHRIKMNFDTANDVSWLQCSNNGGSFSHRSLTCDSCDTELEGIACNRASDKCTYQVQYSDGEEIEAYMSEDTLWLGSQPLPRFTFGCGQDVNGLRSDPSIGLLGLGRNALSLPSQADYLYQKKFSYCLPNFLNPRQRGWLTLGLGSVPYTSKFTALLSNPVATSWYFVGISGISVGGRRLKISPDVFQINSGGGGTIIDSGVLISRLVQPAYNALRAAFVKKMALVPLEANSQIPLDTCFSFAGDIRTLVIPGIAFHFQDGAHIHIHKEGILTPVSDSVICLAFQPADTDGLSIIGSLQQQRYVVSFDEHHRRIGFASVRTCTDLQF